MLDSPPIAAPAPPPAEDEASWSPALRDAWRRLEAYEFDDEGASLPFSARLARDNAWTRDFAVRAIAEYRRFCFLALVCEHPVTPSDQVDQVWHLHLQYSRAYWKHFCPEVLQRELHHGPTRGGSDQGKTFDDQYARTRFAYRNWFGHLPPADLWPGAEERFGRDTRWIRINSEDHLLLPHPRRWWRWTRDRLARLFAGLGTIALLLLLASCASDVHDSRPHSLRDAGWNPLDLAGGPFLSFFWSCCVAVAAAGLLTLVLRLRARTAGRGLDAEEPPLFAAAWLCGGEARTLTTAVARIVERGWGYIETGSRRLIASKGEQRARHPLVRALLDHARSTRPRAFELLSRPPAALRAPLERVRRRLIDADLIVAKPASFPPEAVLLALAPLALAAPRIWNAVPAGRPFGHLLLSALLLSLAGFFAAVIYWKGNSTLTEGGRGWRRDLRRRARWKRGSGSAKSRDEELLLRVAALGFAAVPGTALADLRIWEGPMQNGMPAGGQGDTSFSSGGGCGGGGCCGGGCGGCGGCGG